MSRFKTSLLMASLCFLISPVSLLHAAECISVAGKKLDPAQIYDSRHQCGTCTGQREKPQLCATINRIMVPDWSAVSDLVAVPHRGLWGRPPGQGAAENTLAAAHAAYDAGYRVMEFDALLLDESKAINEKAVMSRYTSANAAGGPKNKLFYDYEEKELQNLYMRYRDQTMSHEPGNNLTLIDDLLQWALNHQVLIIIDPYGRDYKVFAAVLNRAVYFGALGNIVLRAPNGGGGSYAKHLKRFITGSTWYPYYTYYEGRFLWLPTINETPEIAPISTEIKIADWHRETNESKGILAYNINMYSPDHWSAKSYSETITLEPAATWINFIDRFKNLTPLGKRAAIWSRDAMGDKGRLNSQYAWNFVTNSQTDTRGNPFRNLSYDFATHLLVVSDRPEWYEQAVIRASNK